MLLDGLTKPIKMLSGLSAPEQWLIDWVGGGSMTASGEKVNEDTALACAAVKAAVTVLAETVACVSLDVFRDRKGGGKDLATDHPVQWLLHDQPNEETGSSTFRETLQGHLGTWGNGYAEIQRLRNGAPAAIWQRLPQPGRTKPFRDEKDKRIYYECRDEKGALEANIPAADMFHIPGFGFDGLVGYSPIGHLREAIGSNLAAERYASELFANDARPNGVVTVEGELGDEAYNRAKKQFNEDRAEHGKRHRTMLLEGGAKYAVAQMNPEDVQMIDARKFGVEEIARAYRMSPHLLQDLTHGTFSNITELGRQFIVFTMMPWFTRWRTEINRKLLKPPYHCRFNYKSFLEADHKTRAEFYFRLWQMGAVTANDILDREGENGIGPEGDLRFVPVNMQTLETAMNPPEPAPAPGTPGEEKPEKKPQEKPPEKPEKQSAVSNAARGVLVDALGRMMRKEANAAKRAAKNGFADWLGPFYERHEQTVCEAVASGVAVLRAAERRDDVTADVIAHAYTQAAREELEKLVGLDGEALAEAVAEMTAAWNPETRLNEVLYDG